MFSRNPFPFIKFLKRSETYSPKTSFFVLEIFELSYGKRKKSGILFLCKIFFFWSLTHYSFPSKIEAHYTLGA
jgi:hypothetical protein